MKISLIVLLALFVTMALRKRSAALRHWILAVAIACAALTPLMERVLPTWTLARGVTAFVERVAAREPPPDPPRSRAASERSTRPSAAPAQPATPGLLQRITIGDVLTSVWVGGMVISLLVLIVGLSRLAWLASHARTLTSTRWNELVAGIAAQHGQRRPVLLLQSDHPSLLVTWGWLRPRIILPAAADEWSDDLTRVVLSHELAHIRRGDWIVQMLGELLRSFHWFNPLVWIACRRLRLESEHACDDAVLNRGVGGSDYATHLLDLARALNQRRAWLPAAAMARPSSLQRRVTAMLNVRLDRSPMSPFARTAVAAVVVVAAIAIAAAQAFATLSGTLVDPSGAVLPGVTVKLANAERQAKYEVQSNRAGQFEFVGLVPGTYALEAQLPGFKSFQATVTMGSQTVDRRITMEVGTLHEAITIRDGASAPAPQTAAARAPMKPRTNPPCPADPPAAGTTRVGGNIRPPAKIKDARPEYPASLRGTGTEATVIVDGRIGVEGFIKDIQVRDGADPTFTGALIAALNQWQFDSTLLNCVPVEPSIVVTARFLAQ